MTTQDLLTLLDEGVRNGRVAPYLAAYIAAELGEVEYETAGGTGADEQPPEADR